MSSLSSSSSSLLSQRASVVVVICVRSHHWCLTFVLDDDDDDVMNWMCLIVVILILFFILCSFDLWPHYWVMVQDQVSMCANSESVCVFVQQKWSLSFHNSLQWLKVNSVHVTMCQLWFLNNTSWPWNVGRSKWASDQWPPWGSRPGWRKKSGRGCRSNLLTRSNTDCVTEYYINAEVVIGSWYTRKGLWGNWSLEQVLENVTWWWLRIKATAQLLFK